ncbi:MAG: Uma2 family endonuclease [Pyrinomonadaceae bacterium]|nr:Uma2 family endonuclease [Pyrinomonadaceae bacterium]
MSQSNLAQSKEYYTVEEYLAFEREAAEKHKYINGEIVAMAGASREHNLIGTNLTFAFVGQLRGKTCEVYANDMRVRMNPEHYGYPDVVVVCGEPEFADNEFDVLLNPTVIIEVLSASTKLRDRTEKLEDFRKIESLQECLLVEQKKIFIQHYIKQTPNQWLLRIYENADEVVKMESVGCEIAVSDVYLQVKFDAES